MIEKCETCGEYHMIGTPKHICDPIWFAGPENDPDTWEEIRAKNEQKAAERWMAQEDSAAWSWAMDETELEVYVHNLDSGKTTKWLVSGQVEPTYTANQVLAQA